MRLQATSRYSPNFNASSSNKSTRNLQVWIKKLNCQTVGLSLKSAQLYTHFWHNALDYSVPRVCEFNALLGIYNSKYNKRCESGQAYCCTCCMFCDVYKPTVLHFWLSHMWRRFFLSYYINRCTPLYCFVNRASNLTQFSLRSTLKSKQSEFLNSGPDSHELK